MMRFLFQIYRKSPFWLRECLARLAVPLRFLLRPLRRVRMDAYTMYVDFQDNAAFKYFADKGNYEKTERDAFLKCAAHNPGCYVLDLGAHYGAYSLASARLAELELVKHVIAFEPDSRPRECLKNSIKANGWQKEITVQEVIVGDEEGTETLFLNARSSSDNRTHQVTSAPIRCRGEEQVRTTTVDRILEEMGISYENRFLIKMDIQGNEPRAIKGMKRLFEEAEGYAMFFEVGPYLLRSAGSSVDELIELITSISPEGIYQFDGDRLQRIESLEAFKEEIDRLDQSSSNAQGACNDYIVLKNFRLEPAKHATIQSEAVL